MTKSTYLNDYKTKKDFKIILCGDASVGKTTLLNRYLNGFFQKWVRPTVGVNTIFLKHKESLGDDIGRANNPDLTTIMETDSLSFWDLGGQKLFAQIRPNYMIGTDAVLLLFSLNDQRSFLDVGETGNTTDMQTDHSIGQFLVELVRTLGPNKVKEVPILLVGTKSDLFVNVDMKHISYVVRKLKKAGLNVISWRILPNGKLKVFTKDNKEDHHAPFGNLWVGTSSKTGRNVDLAFKIILEALKNWYSLNDGKEVF